MRFTKMRRLLRPSVEPLPLVGRKFGHRLEHVRHYLRIHLKRKIKLSVKAQFVKVLPTFNLSLHPFWATISFPFSTMNLRARARTLEAPCRSDRTSMSGNKKMVGILQNPDCRSLPSTLSVLMLVHRLSSHICFNSCII